MQYTWKSLSGRLAHAVMFAMVLVFTSGISQAQNLAFSPGSDVVAAGDPADFTFANVTPSPATYVGPAAGLVPQAQGFYGTASDKYGNIYVSEIAGNIVRVIASGSGPIPVLGAVGASPQAGYVYTVLGTGVNTSGTPNGVEQSCQSMSPAPDAYGDGCPATEAIYGGGNGGMGGGIAVDSDGNVYLTDSKAGLIRVVYAGTSTNPIPNLPSGAQAGYVYAIAGVPGQTGYMDTTGSAAGSTQIGAPGWIAVDPSGNVFFTSFDNNNYVPILLALSVHGGLPGFQSATNGYVYTIVGEAAELNGNVQDGVSASTSGFVVGENGNPIGGLATDSSGNIYVSDYFGVRVIFVQGSVPGLSSLIPGNIYTMAGTIDGSGSIALPPFPGVAKAVGSSFFNFGPQGALSFDAAGSLYIYSEGIFRVDPSGNLSTVYGTGNAVVVGNKTTRQSCITAVDAASDGCTNGTLNNNWSITVDPLGNIWAPDGTYLVLHEQDVMAPTYFFTPGWTQPIVIYNTGSQPFQLEQLTATPPYQLVSTGSSDCETALPNLPPGGSCVTSIQFPSGNTSAPTGTLTVTSTSGTNVIQLTSETAAQLALHQTTVTWSSPAPANNIAAGVQQNYTLNFNCPGCASGTAPPSGQLALYSGSTQIVTQAVTALGKLTFSGVTLPTGNNLLYAVYSGDSSFAPSQSGQALVDVSGTPSTTSLKATPNPAATGATITLAATVSPTTSDGSVTFKNGNAVIATVPVSGGSASTTTIASPTPGTATFTASYAGSTTYNPSTSAVVSVMVQAPATTMAAVQASTTSPAEGAGVSFTATVTASGSTAPTTGTVQFYDNGMALGTAQPVTIGSGNTATATLLNVTTLPEGSNAITAVYSGSTDGLFSASLMSPAVKVTVGLPATATTLTAQPSSITYGQSVTLTASITQQVGGAAVPNGGSVSFTAGSTNLGTATVSNGAATLTTTTSNPIPGGSGTVNTVVTATYSDPTQTLASSSNTATVSVVPLGTATTTPVASNPNPDAGTQITLSTTVTAPGFTPTGTVTFYNNGTTQLCVGNFSNGTFSCPFTPQQQGTDSITAVYTGGNGLATSTSPALSLNVAAQPSSTSTSLMVSTTTLSTTSPVTFTATVTNTGSGTGTLGGQVTFQAGSTVLGTANLSANGVATFTTTFSTAGGFQIMAIYQGNASFNGSTSNTVTVNVSTALAASTTTLTLSSAAVQQGSNVTFTAKVVPTSTSSTITPTGTVTFYNGGAQIPNSTSTLTGGVATFSTATLNPATYSITAEYSGDQNYSPSSSTAAALTVGAPTPSFTLNATPSSLTVTSGQSGAAIITLIPTYGYSGTISLSCGTLPANVTCSFSPTTLTADGKNDTVQSTLTVSTNNGTAQLREPNSFWHRRNNEVLPAALFFLPAGLLGLGFTSKRKRLGQYLSLALLAFLGAGLLTLSGCAGGNGGSTNDAAKGTSQITVTAASSAGGQTQTVNLSVTIQ